MRRSPKEPGAGRSFVFFLVALLFGGGAGGALSQSSPLIPDPNLEAAIRLAIAKPTGELTREDLLSLQALSATGQKIADLTGLELALNLSSLRLGGNKISSVAPLKNLQQLTELVLDRNRISDVSPISQLGRLGLLDLSWNPVTDICALTNLPAVTSLSLRGVGLMDLSCLSALNNLSFLNLEENQITNLAPLGVLKQLTYLGLTQNPVASADALSNLTSLVYLELRGNAISNLTFLSSLPLLSYADLAYNNISDLGPIPKLPNLTNVVLAGNSAVNYGTSPPLTNVAALWLFDDLLTNIEFLGSLSQLTYLNIENNQIRDLGPLANLTNLTGLALSRNPSTNYSALAGLTNLETLLLNYDWIDDRTLLHGMSRLELLSIKQAKLWDLSLLTGLSNLNTVYLENNHLTNIDVLLSLPNLVRVELSGNLLNTNAGSPAMNVISAVQGRGTVVDYIPQDQPPALDLGPIMQSLQSRWYVAAGQTNTLVFSAFDVVNSEAELLVTATSTNQAFIADNQIGLSGSNGSWSLTVAPVTSGVTEIRLTVTEDGTGLTSNGVVSVIGLFPTDISIPDQALSNAVWTTLGKTDGAITSVDLLALTSLVPFDFGISDLSGLEWATNLSKLALDYTGVSDLSRLSKLYNLNWLSIAAASVTNVSALHNLTNLTYLNLSWNSILDFSPLAGLTKLSQLSLAGVGLSGLNFLVALKQLESIELSANNVRDISLLAGLPNINYLDLAQNLITNIGGLTNLPRLSFVDVSLNLVNTNNDANTLATVQTLVNRGVFVSISPEREFGISGLPNVWFMSTNATATIAFSVDDNDRYPTPVTLSVHSSNTNLVPVRKVVASEDAEGNWSLTIQPVKNAQGLTTITLSATNNAGLSSTATMVLTVMVPLKVALPDPNLTAAILTTVGSTSSNVTLADLLDLRTLNITDQNVSNLVGLGLSTNLTTLQADNNWLSDISPLRKLPHLTFASLSNNIISDISPLSALMNLACLNLGENLVTNYDLFLSGFKGLTNLDLYGNGLTNIYFLTNLTKLTVLGVSHNRLIDVSAIGPLTNLLSLDVNHNLARDITPLSTLSKLSYADLRMNLLDLSENSSARDVISLLGSHSILDFDPQRTPPLFVVANSATVAANADSFLHFYLYENGEATLGNVTVTAESSNTNVIPNESLFVAPEHSTDWSMELTPSGTQLGSTVITLGATNDAGLGSVASILVSVFMPLGVDGPLLGATNVIWQTSGDEPWFGQGNILFGGKPTAQSGRIGSGGQSILQANVVGPALLRFWWKVSSEADWDWLTFESLQQTNMISGEVDWQLQQLAIAPGLQTVTWRYTKDPDCCGIGLDSGWLADVQFIGRSWLDSVTSADGQTSFVVHGLPGHTYELQYSTNLVQWFPIATVLVTNIAMPSQRSASGDAAGFYRLLDTTN